MTMPALISDKQAKERVAQLKKVYSTLSQAFIMAVSENGTPDEWGMTGMYDGVSHEIMATNMAKHMKLAQNCIHMTSITEIEKVCSPPKNYGDTASARNVVLLDGTSVSFRNWNYTCNSNYSKDGVNKALQHTCGEIAVDLNGTRLPNKNGEDKFQFYFTRDALVPFGVQGDSHQFERACNRKIDTPYPGFSPYNMYACTAWVLYNENMDYLKCDDLTWKGKTKCK